jgi:tRNA threonylcarbamoyladenosine biosynthesis protein TsaE
MILTEPELVRWGNRIGREVSGPIFLGLKGALGAGKSVLARSVAKGAGVEGPVPSPTFNLLFEYATTRGFPLLHMDLYRLMSEDELWELGWEELGASAEVALVEWPERAGGLLPKDRWEIELVVPEPGSDLREVSVSRFGRPLHLPGFPVTLEERLEERDRVEGEEDGSP